MRICEVKDINKWANREDEWNEHTVRMNGEIRIVKAARDNSQTKLDLKNKE